MVEEGQATDDLTFTHQELEEKVMIAIEAVLTNIVYQEAEVPKWINEICERIVFSLYQARKPFKYMVTCMIMQKTDAAMQTSTACNFEGGTDMALQFMWPKEKSKDQVNKSMHCVVTIFSVRF